MALIGTASKSAEHGRQDPLEQDIRAFITLTLERKPSAQPW